MVLDEKAETSSGKSDECKNVHVNQAIVRQDIGFDDLRVVEVDVFAVNCDRYGVVAERFDLLTVGEEVGVCHLSEGVEATQ